MHIRMPAVLVYGKSIADKGPDINVIDIEDRELLEPGLTDFGHELFANFLASLAVNLARFHVDQIFSQIAPIAGRQDVIENYVTLHDGLSRYYLGGRFAWQPLRHGGISGQVRSLWYDDDNSALEFNIDTYYMLSTYPRILKIIGKYYEYHVSRERFDYWTPRDYCRTRHPLILVRLGGPLPEDQNLHRKKITR